MARQEPAADHEERTRSPSSRSRPELRSRCSSVRGGVGRPPDGPGPPGRRPAGSRCSSSRTTARSRRVTRWRTTELPTDLPTTKPARAPAGGASGDAEPPPVLLGPFGEEVEHHGRPPGTPAGPDDRGELRTPAQARLRGQHVRRRASRDPCADDRRGSTGPRGCASAAGSRGSWTDGGCSAGTCACSRGTPTTRHRRCAPTGGRARAGRPGRTAMCRSPATPEAGHCGLGPTPTPTCTDELRGREGGRNRPQTPASITEERLWPETGRIPTAHGPPDKAPCRRRHAGADAPGRAPGALPGCGRGC